MLRALVVVALLGSSAIAEERPTVEVKETVRPDRVRLRYTVRNISTGPASVPIAATLQDPDAGSATAALAPNVLTPSVVTLTIGVSDKTGQPTLASMPLSVDSPEGWHPTLTGVGEGAARRWRVTWTCADAGFDHRMAHRVKSGDRLGGFAVDLPRADSTYTAGQFRVAFDRSATRTGRIFRARD